MSYAERLKKSPRRSRVKFLKRVYEHKNDLIWGFTKKYHIHNLVYYEVYRSISDAINREKRMKKWKRQWKIELIKKSNPQWRDLYSDIVH
jgi:putative endonuclease